jgi:hypothetical protein
MAYLVRLPDQFNTIPDVSYLSTTGGALNVNNYADGSPEIRRPLRGTERKEDSYASIKIVSAGDRPKKLKNSSSTEPSEYYYNFLLQDFVEQRMEKSQIIETFGQSYVYFFGERTTSIQFRGILLNTQDFNWKAEFLYNYDKYFRGTKLVAGGYRAFIRIGDDLIGGYLAAMNVSTSTNSPEEVPFSFDLIVTDRALLSTESRNSTKNDGYGQPVVVIPPPDFTLDLKEKKKGTFESVVQTVRDGLTAVSDGIDTALLGARALLLGRNIRVPESDINAASDLQIRTIQQSIGNTGISRTALLRGQPIKVNYFDSLDGFIGKDPTGKVTRNEDEYIWHREIVSLDPNFTNDPRFNPQSTDKAVRKFLLANGLADFQVNGIPLEARLIGRVAYGVLSLASPSIGGVLGG